MVCPTNTAGQGCDVSRVDERKIDQVESELVGRRSAGNEMV